MASRQFKGDPLEGPVEVVMLFKMRRPKKPKFNMPAVTPDIDNLQKSISDALNKIVWKDDCQVVQIKATKIYTNEVGALGNVLVMVRPIDATMEEYVGHQAW